MSKKMMLLALAVASAAMFAMPAVASAGTPVVDNLPANGEFTIHGGAGNLQAAGEPKITCETTTGEGNFTDITGANNSSSGGTITLDFTGCHIMVVFTIQCKSIGSTVGNTVAVSGDFNTTYTSKDKTKPGITVTPTNATLICGTQRIRVTGSVLGTITAPACNTASNTATMSFTQTGGVQDHRFVTNTGSEEVLKATTENSDGTPVGSEVNGALEAEATITFPVGSTPKITCV
jgi:hypothetical protein